MLQRDVLTPSAVLLHLEHLRRPFPARPILAVQLHELLAVVQRLCSGADLEDRPAADHFLCLGERTVGDCELAFLDAKPRCGGAGLEAARVYHLARSEAFLDELAHGFQQRRGWTFGSVLLARLDQRQEFHRRVSIGMTVSVGSFVAVLHSRTTWPQIDKRLGLTRGDGLAGSLQPAWTHGRRAQSLRTGDSRSGRP